MPLATFLYGITPRFCFCLETIRKPKILIDLLQFSKYKRENFDDNPETLNLKISIFRMKCYLSVLSRIEKIRTIFGLLLNL